jgi:hypothetical protein
MTLLEFVQACAVTKVARQPVIGRSRVGAPSSVTMTYTVTVSMPDGGKLKLNPESRTSWRRVMKRAKLKLTSKVARAAAAEFRQKIADGLAAEKNSPAAAALDAKSVLQAEKRAKKRDEHMAAERRRVGIESIRKLMVEFQVTEEEAMDAWRSSVVEHVMTA